MEDEAATPAVAVSGALLKAATEASTINGTAAAAAAVTVAGSGTSKKAWLRLADWSFVLSMTSPFSSPSSSSTITRLDNVENSDANKEKNKEELGLLVQAVIAYGKFLRLSVSGNGVGEEDGEEESGSSGGEVKDGAASTRAVLRMLQALVKQGGSNSNDKERTSDNATDTGDNDNGDSDDYEGSVSWVAQEIASTPIEPWVVVVPQLLARLAHPAPSVADAILSVLERVCLKFPQAIVTQVIVGRHETAPPPPPPLLSPPSAARMKTKAGEEGGEVEEEEGAGQEGKEGEGCVRSSEGCNSSSAMKSSLHVRYQILHRVLSSRKPSSSSSNYTGFNGEKKGGSVGVANGQPADSYSINGIGGEDGGEDDTLVGEHEVMVAELKRISFLIDERWLVLVQVRINTTHKLLWHIDLFGFHPSFLHLFVRSFVRWFHRLVFYTFFVH
jgi:hypothetical protein